MIYKDYPKTINTTYHKDGTIAFVQTVAIKN